MTFGEKLKKYRKASELTQRELAEKAGLGLNTINNYEKGKTYPQNREVYKILAEILNVNVDELRNENEEFITAGTEKYGSAGRRQARELVGEIQASFAGGELADEDLDEMMRAIQESYWIAKDKNKKFAPKKSSSEINE